MHPSPPRQLETIQSVDNNVAQSEYIENSLLEHTITNSNSKEKFVDRSANAVSPTFTPEQLKLLEDSKQYAAYIQTVYLDLFEKAKAEQQLEESKAQTGNSVNTLQLHNLSILSRIYIGSIHFELTENDLRMAFSAFGPIKSISLSNDPVTGHHKGFCFIEFETPEAAALAVETLNGGELGGRPIKIGRPNNFPPALPPGLPRPLPNRLYVSNIHECVKEEDVIQIFSSFGNVEACSLVPDPVLRKHKGYGFLQFSRSGGHEAQAALLALKSGFQLAGLSMKVGRTILGGDMPTGMSILDRLPPTISGSQSALLRNKPLPKAVLNAAKSITQSVKNVETASPPIPTYSVLILRNLVDYSELDADVKAEVVEECEKSGAIKEAHIVSEDKIDVIFYIVYHDSMAASKAAAVFQGRWFGGKQVTAAEISYSDFEMVLPSLNIIM